MAVCYVLVVILMRIDGSCDVHLVISVHNIELNRCKNFIMNLNSFCSVNVKITIELYFTTKSLSYDLYNNKCIEETKHINSIKQNKGTESTLNIISIVFFRSNNLQLLEYFQQTINWDKKQVMYIWFMA